MLSLLSKELSFTFYFLALSFWIVHFHFKGVRSDSIYFIFQLISFKQTVNHQTGHHTAASLFMGGTRGGTGGPDPSWNCQIIDFCHVEIFRQTPSGNLDPPPPRRRFSGSAHAVCVYLIERMLGLCRYNDYEHEQYFRTRFVTFFSAVTTITVFK